ncbi:MAG TPA: acyl-CoA desaturase [Acidimicrobiia bacterium]|nr:acyl-CoA desaturase [Acidimicrobiia bacterium]
MQMLEERPMSAPPPTSPEPPSEERSGSIWPQQLLTAVVILAPVVALGVILSQVLRDGLAWYNIAIAAAFYFVIGHGVTIGFHRLFTHKSFEARRPLKIALALIGSLSFQGSLIGWVADHRRHHMFTERDGDPHTPTRPPDQSLGRLRGLIHAHVGWLFEHADQARQKYVPDLLADRDLVLIDRLFVPLCIATFVLPFGIGYAITGRFTGGLALFLWAGLLRVGVLHHVSWSTNSLCHTFGRRPFKTTDASTNFAPLAVLSMGECWHNAHHAFPALARHGVDRFQLDTSAMVIRAFERLGWATRVRWPDQGRLAARRVPTGARRSAGVLSPMRVPNDG